MTRYLLLPLLVLGLSGCFQSLDPLSPPGPPDRSVTGVWVSRHDPNNTVYLHILIDTTERMKLVRVNHPRTKSGAVGGSEQYDIFPTFANGQRYMNISFPSPDEATSAAPPSRYWFVRYSLSPAGALSVWHTSYESLRDAVGRGSLNGKAWHTTWGSNVSLTSSSKALLAFFAQAPDVWGAEQRYERVAED